MKVLIDIPKEFEVDYHTDRFRDLFERAVADMDVMKEKLLMCLQKHLKKADYTIRIRLWSSWKNGQHS